jgi:hypothetical protein
MSETSRPSDLPDPSDVAKDIAYFTKTHGVDLVVVTPTVVNVERSSGAIENDWYVVAYNGEEDMYLVRKSNGLLKELSATELRTLNSGLTLPLPSVPDAMSGQSTNTPGSLVLMGDRTRKALLNLGLGVELHNQYIAKLTLIASAVADRLQQEQPEIANRLLSKFLTASGVPFHSITGDAQASAVDLIQRAVTTPGVSSRPETQALITVAEPYLRAILSDPAFMDMVEGLATDPALVNEMIMQIVAQVLERAYVAKMQDQ